MGKLTNSTLATLFACTVVAKGVTVSFSDPNWKNPSGGTSAFLTNGNDEFTGHDLQHTLTNASGSGVDVTLDVNLDASNSSQTGFNIENRPAEVRQAFVPYFGNGNALRMWTGNNPTNGEDPSFTVSFSQDVKLTALGLEGYRYESGWLVQAFDASGALVTPNWTGAELMAPASVIEPNAANQPVNPINLFSTTGANGADAESSGFYSSAKNGFVAYNKNNEFARGGAIVNYKGAEVRSIKYTLVSVSGGVIDDPLSLGARRSIYIGAQFDITPVAVPEPSSFMLVGIGAVGFLVRRRRR